MIANISVEPWMISHPPSSSPSPREPNSASIAPSIAPFWTSSSTVGMPNAKPKAKHRIETWLLWVNR